MRRHRKETGWECWKLGEKGEEQEEEEEEKGEEKKGKKARVKKKDWVKEKKAEDTPRSDAWNDDLPVEN